MSESPGMGMKNREWEWKVKMNSERMRERERERVRKGEGGGVCVMHIERWSMHMHPFLANHNYTRSYSYLERAADQRNTMKCHVYHGGDCFHWHT
jgi:hypothetical protein